jgi:peptide/nickel transport system permease protein
MNAPVPLPQPGAPLPHYVSTAPFDVRSIEEMTAAQERIYLASQWRLMWWRFQHHKVAVFSLWFLAVLYFCIVICEFLAPYNLHTRNVDFIHAPPQAVHLFHDGKFVGPFVYGRKMSLDLDTLKRQYSDKHDDVQRLRFFCHGDSYRFWG